jgi:DNA-binding LacI/PurR family transcriptional regulator
MGRVAARLLVSMITESLPEIPPRTVLETELVVRGSSRREKV